jgi:glycosyltransferase involved in cell wall biosynthesis
LTLSIIIPTHNEEANLLELATFFEKNIDSSYNIEVIVADSSSITRCEKKLEGKYIFLATNKVCRASQMNDGAKIARGDILVFLHADVRPPVNFINDICNTIHEGYEFGFFAYKFNPSSWILNVNSSFTHKKGIFSGGGDQIHFFSKKRFFELGGYRENFVIMEDFDMMRRVKSLKIPYTILKSQAIVSSRKYVKNSWLRVNLANLIAFSQFVLGVNPEKIRTTYTMLIKK